MKIGWTEGSCLHMDAFVSEDHSYIATLVDIVRSDDTSGKCFETVKAAIRHHLVNVQTIEKPLQNFVRRKRKPLLRDTPFSFTCSCKAPNSTASGATISTIRRTARGNWKHGETCCQVCQMCVITGELMVFLCLKIGGTGGARHEFAADISFFKF